MKKIIILFYLCFFSYYIFSQNDCQIGNSLEIKSSDINQNYIQNKIEKERLTYSVDEISKIKKQIDDCNNNITNELLPIKTKITEYSLKMQDVFTYKDIRKLNEQIEILKQSKLKAEELLEEHLSQKTKHSGLFLVILKNIDPYGNKNVFIKKAEQALIPKAIENLNGTYIKRLTEVNEFKSVKDIIWSLSKGKVTTAEQYIHKALYVNKQFVFFAKIQVAPLKEELNETKNINNISNTEVIDVLNEADYINVLQNLGVTQEIIDDIQKKVNLLKSTIETENKASDDMQNNIITESNAKIKILEIDISENERRLSTRINKIKEILSEANIPYNPNNPEENANKALDYFKNKIQGLDKKWNEIKNKEVQYRVTNVMIESSPPRDLAFKTVDLYKQIKKSNLTKVVKSSEVFQINNYEIENYQTGEKIEVFREIKKIWIYPIPQNDGGFKLMIAFKFKITDKIKSQETLTNRTNLEKIKQSFFVESIKMIYVKGGTFQIENNDDAKLVRNVKIEDFYISDKEITNLEFCKFLNAKGNKKEGGVSWFEIEDPDSQIELRNGLFYVKKGKENYPIVEVTWYGAKAYCKWIGGRLPTKAEWQYTARGGNKSKNYKYSGSNNINDVAWYNGNSESKPHSVGIKKANELGIYDMSGNVREWVEDNSNNKDLYCINCGGGWSNNSRNCRSVHSYKSKATRSSGSIGFRLVYIP